MAHDAGERHPEVTTGPTGDVQRGIRGAHRRRRHLDPQLARTQAGLGPVGDEPAPELRTDFHDCTHPRPPRSGQGSTHRLDAATASGWK